MTPTKFYLGASICDGSAGTRSIVQLWNPTTSGFNFTVSMLYLASTYADNAGFDLRFNYAPLGAIMRRGIDKFDRSTSLLELRSVNVAPNAIPGDLCYEPWPDEKFSDKPYPFDPPITLRPGDGLLVCNAFDGAYTIVSVQFGACAV